MKTPLTINSRLVQRIACAMLAAFLVVAALPMFQPGRASAATQLAYRSIQLSDSANSGTSIASGVGSGTAVTYRVSFTTAAAAQSLVIDFCSNDPIIADTCTAPTGMSAASATIGTVSGGGNITNAGWTPSNSATQIKLAKASGSATSVGAQQFDVVGITNPSTIGSFYARIYTYSNATFGTYNSAAFTGPGTGPGNYLDYGGVALSTTNTITITARVQETLTFCVTAADPDTWLTTSPGDCAASEVAAAPPALTLGHGSPTKILDSQQVDFGNVWTQTSTNATHGAVINMRSNPGGSFPNSTCGGLSADSGATCAIPPVNSGSATPSTIVAGTAAFGMHATTYAPTVSGTYNDGTHVSPGNASGNTPASTVFYGMDNTSSQAAIGTSLGSPAPGFPTLYNDKVSGIFGNTIAFTDTPVYRADNRYTFAATASLLTPAGLYSSNISLIATGTF